MEIRFNAATADAYALVVDYLAAHNPAAAERFVSDVDTALARLQRFPALGAPVAAPRPVPLRQFLVPPYRFFYRVEQDTLWVVALWHEAQQVAHADR